MEIRNKCPYNNKYYITISKGGLNGAITGKPTKAGANVLANCVGYANGRFAEIIGKEKIEYQLVCDAENFIEKAKSYGLQVVNYPTLGGIMCWQKGSISSHMDGAGHVAIVERIDSNSQIYTSESSYGGSYFYNATRKNTNGNWGQNLSYTFRGCIVNPAISNEEPKKENYYIVKQGDNLSKIGSIYGIPWQKIYEVNKDIIGENPNIIKAGQRLVIPNVEKKYYIVQKGDNLIKIGKMFNTTVNQLVSLNHIGNPNLIITGQKLIVG